MHKFDTLIYLPAYSSSCRNRDETNVVMTVHNGLNNAVKRGPLRDTHQDWTKNDNADDIPYHLLKHITRLCFISRPIGYKKINSYNL